MRIVVGSGGGGWNGLGLSFAAVLRAPKTGAKKESRVQLGTRFPTRSVPILRPLELHPQTLDTGVSSRRGGSNDVWVDIPCFTRESSTSAASGQYRQSAWRYPLHLHLPFRRVSSQPPDRFRYQPVRQACSSGRVAPPTSRVCRQHASRAPGALWRASTH